MTPAEAVKDLQRRRKQLDKLPDVVKRGALFYQGQVQAGMSGRPGPNAITGGARRAVKAQPPISSNGGRIVRAVISSNHPAARRLELGFADTDSLGRVYNQPPFPHWATAVPKLDKFMVVELRRLMAA